MEDKQFLDKMVASICTILCGLNFNHMFFDFSMSSLSSQSTYVFQRTLLFRAQCLLICATILNFQNIFFFYFTV